MEKFSVIIPNWNGERHLPDCLDALRNQICTDFQLVLVDNGSTDRSTFLVRTGWPDATIVELPENIGFAAAVNRGISVSRGRYVILLNNDTQAAQDWLAKLSKAVDENPELSIFASLLVNFYDRNAVDSAGDGMRLVSGPFKIGEKLSPKCFSLREYVFGACGGGGCYRKEIFNQVGLFDEDFFAYFEDADFSFRANWCGYRSMLVPDAVIYHKVGGTSNTTRQLIDKFDILRRRNFIFLVVKNYPLVSLIKYGPAILLIHVAKMLLNICKGRFRVAFQTQLNILRGLPKILAKRKLVMASRNVSSAEMISICSTRSLHC